MWVLVITFGRFEQHKPVWRRLAKFALLLTLLLVLIEPLAARRAADVALIRKRRRRIGHRRTGFRFSLHTYSISSPSGSSACGWT
jgi:hypothetical protein